MIGFAIGVIVGTVITGLCYSLMWGWTLEDVRRKHFSSYKRDA